MQMGYEILFFWMARMILMSTYAIDQIPFRNVYIHGMLRSESGKKFSKSSGNNIDPLEVIAKFGTDALRLSVISGIAPGNDSKFYEEKVEGARNMVNKLWNISRYILPNIEKEEINFGAGKLTISEDWILTKLQVLIKEVTEDLNNYNFSSAGERLRGFTWNDLADWYLEANKFEQSEQRGKILYYILKNLLILWHPFTPFMTEAIWQKMAEDNLLIIQKWPIFDKASGIKSAGNFEVVKDIIAVIRNVRSENKIEPVKKVKVVIYAGGKKKFLESQAHLIKNLRTGISELEIKDKGEKIAEAIYAAAGGVEIYLLGAVDSEKEKVRLEKEISNLEKMIASVEGRLANKEFIDKAPAEIVKKEKDKLKGWKAELKSLKSR
jgi:valyl-tRNA synthetase